MHAAECENRLRAQAQKALIHLPDPTRRPQQLRRPQRRRSPPSNMLTRCGRSLAAGLRSIQLSTETKGVDRVRTRGEREPSAGRVLRTYLTYRVAEGYTKYVVQFIRFALVDGVHTYASVYGMPRRGLHSRHALQAYFVPVCGYASRRRVPCPGALFRGFPCRVRCCARVLHELDLVNYLVPEHYR